MTEKLVLKITQKEDGVFSFTLQKPIKDFMVGEIWMLVGMLETLKRDLLENLPRGEETHG